jgi:hypothetical protein
MSVDIAKLSGLWRHLSDALEKSAFNGKTRLAPKSILIGAKRPFRDSMLLEPLSNQIA